MKSMRACFYQKFGGPTVLEKGELAVPALAAESGDVLIRVHAAGLNPIDYKKRQGSFRMILSADWPIVVGHDFSGVIVECGAKANKFAIGDAVFGFLPYNRAGTLADYVVASECFLTLKPDKLSHIEAAAIPMVSLAALQSFRQMDLQEGSKVLITGGAGGVGTIAVQMAKKCFKVTTVATTSSEKKKETVGELGADLVINYQEKKFQYEICDYDCALDCTGESRQCMECIIPGGKVVSISDTPPKVGLLGLEQFGVHVGCLVGIVLNCLSQNVARKARSYGVNYSYIMCKPSGEQMKEIASYFEKNLIVPVIDKVVSFDNCLDALGYLEGGHATGKVVVEMVENQFA